MRRRTRKIVVWSAGALGGLVVILLALALLVPTLVAPLQIREKIQNAFAEELGGRIDFEMLRISAFPPKGRLKNARVSFPNQAVSGTAASAAAYLRILPLLRGEVQIRSVRVNRPDFEISLPDPSPSAEKEDLQSLLQGLAGTAYGGLARLQTSRPDVLITLVDGKLRLTRKGAPFLFENIQGEVNFDKDVLSARFDAGSNLWGELHFRSAFDLGPMTGGGKIEVTGFKPHLIEGPPEPNDRIALGDSQLNARVSFRLKGPQTLEGEWVASAPLLTIRRGKTEVPLKVAVLRGEARIAEGAVDLTLSELTATAPPLRLSGRYTEPLDGSAASLELTGKEVDVGPLRDLALVVAGQVPAVRETLEVVRGGKITRFALTSRGKSRQEVLDPGNLNVQGDVANVDLRIPDLQLNLAGVGGAVSFSKGILKGEGLGARLGNTRASNGRLTLGLEGKDPPFQLDVQLKADLAEVPSTLGRIVEDQPFLAELKRIRHMEGTAHGRLILGERLESLRASVEIASMRVRGEYERLPHPFEISEGRLQVENTHVTWSRVDGSMGRSSFSRSAGQVDLKKGHIRAGFEEAVADLAQIHGWLPLIQAVQEEIRDIRSVRGKAHLLSTSAEGVLTSPSSWVYQSRGRVEAFALDASFFPAAMAIHSADFEADPEGVRFWDARMDMGDASLTDLSGAVTGYRQGALRVDLLLNGAIGPRTNDWLVATAGIPPELQLRAPLTVSEARVAWGGALDTLFSGDIAVAGGARISLELTRTGQGFLSIPRLLVTGQDSRASIVMTLAEAVMELKFEGSLSEATLRQAMEKDLLRGGWIKGDFSVRVLKGDLALSTVQGTIEAGDLAHEFSPGDPVKVRYVSMRGDGNRVRFDSASLSWRGTQMLLDGAVGFSPAGIEVDLAVSSDGFTWRRVIEERKGEDAPGKPQRTGGIAPVPVSGTIRVRAEHFEVDGLRWEPMAFELQLKGKRAELKLAEGRICAIPTEAPVKIPPEPTAPKAGFESRGREPEPTRSCLLDTRLVSGEFDLDHEVWAWGAPQDLLRNLHGKFRIDAGEGRIRRFGLLSKVLGVINITEIFKGELPDLGRGGLGYKSALFVGTIENGVVKLEEGAIDAHSMGLAFEGGIDLPAENLDITVLVAPLKTVDSIIGNIPIIGGILGKEFIAIPVRVRGDWSNPTIIPLSPTAVGSKLLGIVERTLKLPFRLFQPFLGNKEKK